MLVPEDEREPPTSVTFNLQEALELLAALEEARATLQDGEHLAGVLTSEASSQLLSRRLGFDDGETMPAEPLIAAEAAERLDLPIKELWRLVYERKIRYVMVNGIAHVPEDAVDEYRREAAS